MGKKHKKHRGEKGPELGLAAGEYVEKPLKLVLKVGGGEVKELSASRVGHDASFYEDRLEHEKHKDKKKKKKRKEDKPTEEEKKIEKKKVDKKKDGKNKEDRKKDEKKKKTKSERKKDRGHTDSECDADFMLHSPMNLETPHLKLVKPEEEQTPLQEALNQLMRQLQRKDPSAFFSFPVTDFIAPGYSMIIKNPMDFSTIREKIRNNEYQSIEELKDNFKQICHNAMIYNKPETIYHKAAKKLLNSGMKILSQERIQSLKQSIDFMTGVQTNGKPKDPNESQVTGDAKNDPENVKEETMETEDVKSSKTKAKEHKSHRKEKDPLEEKLRNDLLAAREQELIDLIIRQSAGKLTRRAVNSELEFERRRSDGTTTLGVLIPSDPATDFGHGCVKLGIAAGRLQSGVNTLQGFKEDKRNKVTPVAYLNYGPFSTYAPDNDSTLANISKDDSDLIYMTYGEEPNLQGYFSVDDFLAKAQDHPYGMADCLLDAFTNGEHSRSLREEMVVDTDQPLSRINSDSSNNGRFASLSVVTGFDIPGETFANEAAEFFQRKLDETTMLIRELQGAQNERLNTRPPPNMICLLGPSFKEIHLADRVTSNLKELAQQVAPGDVVSVEGLRKAMGISLPFPISTSEDSCIDLTTDIEESRKVGELNER
ncbi:hypothetical protein NDU88_003554 [Pleurodeles waltl]|uniref:Bromo domain-containing protein n=2 Tax=Pleurodeles waltl TaxID=8319 RepID=A0AAV7KYU1_PLEWA|nr:hypothetical protein NDU88_003554 [Pleurodeles waltl]